MYNPQISIIVPVYNAERYLERCLNSILSQSFKNWELLLIDDGSPDNSGALCDAFSSSHPECNIKVIHKSNGGVASAREIGIQNAKGKYSIHLDPDDWIEPEMLHNLHEEALSNNSDIVVCDFIFDYGKKHKVVSRQSVISQDYFLKALFRQDRHGSLCNKLIRTDLYQNFNLHFPEKMICWEDLYICCNILLHPCKISYIPQAFYHYDLHSNTDSISRKATHKTLKSMKLFCDYFEDKLDSAQKIWLNECKGTVKLTAYRCNLMSSKELRLLYNDINEWYIERYLKSFSTPSPNGLAVVLKGYSIKTAKRFEYFNSQYQRLKAKFYKIIKI